MFTNKKWFIMGIIGASTAVGGATFIIMGINLLRTLNKQNVNSSFIIILYMTEQLDLGGMGDILIIQTFLSYSRIQKVFTTIFSMLIYAGIAMVTGGGILSLTGWIRYYQLEHLK
ncbi:MAG: hypothetical protein HWN67_16195 [Candidatus Helarchaeota archaeon]|nr:hypothetical protein [Candidatus Helarchaeota archaeon]